VDHGQEPHLTARKAPAERLRELHEQLHSWELVGRSFGVSGGMAYRVALQGYEPKDSGIRHRLGLPVNPLVMGTAVFCAKCGRAFVGKWGNRRKFCPICRPVNQSEEARDE